MGFLTLQVIKYGLENNMQNAYLRQGKDMWESDGIPVMFAISFKCLFL